MRGLLPPLWLHYGHQRAVCALVSSWSVLVVQPTNCLESVLFGTKLDDGQGLCLASEREQRVKVPRDARVDATQRREGDVGVQDNTARDGGAPTNRTCGSLKRKTSTVPISLHSRELSEGANVFEAKHPDTCCLELIGGCHCYPAEDSTSRSRYHASVLI